MRVDAGAAARAYATVDNRPRTAALIVDGRQVPVDGPEVALTVDGVRIEDGDLVAGDAHEASDHTSLAWTLAAPGDPARLSVRIVVEADVAAGVVRKRAEVTGSGRLERVELDRWAGPGFAGHRAVDGPVPPNAGPPGLGQPVFGPGLFAGVEHPGAENLVTPDDGCSCALPFAVDLGDRPFVTPAVVLGAGGLDGFWDYLDGLRPGPARLVTLANNWYHLGAPGLMDSSTVTAEVAGFAAVARRHHFDLDWACLDDGWDGEWDPTPGLWGRLSPGRFPGGLAALAQVGAEGGIGIGLWVGPFGGYGERQEARVAWGAGQGYEVETAYRLLCVAGDTYRAHLAAAIIDRTRAGVGYWKLDGVRFGCADTGHGHPVGAGARTHQMDRFAALLCDVRTVRPEVVLAFTSGSNPSPWWLTTADFLWRGGLDDSAADHPGSRLDRFATYIDTCLDAYRHAAVPVSALVSFSVVESAAAGYREADGDGDLAGWERHCWMAVGRGTLHHDLYVAPDSLSDAEWDVLARALAWARDHQGVLARSRMVLGRPGAGELYGFVARRDGAATACLRNPSPETRTVELRWADLLGLAGDAPLALETVWGGRTADPDDTTLTLDPFEVLLIAAAR
ncbi:MAG: hypothetical protein M3066_09440 [Actinomycetota bacterium]|nr:hypothetical protein [Actinomycetota bacterium]